MAVSGQTTAASRSKPSRRLRSISFFSSRARPLGPPFLGLRHIGLHDADDRPPAAVARPAAITCWPATPASPTTASAASDARHPAAGAARIDEGQGAQPIDADQRGALQQRRGERPDMAERIPRKAGEDVAAQPFGRGPGDREQNQPAIATAEMRASAARASWSPRPRRPERRRAPSPDRAPRAGPAARSRRAARRRPRPSSRSRP